ncbi:hypothetical protein IC620_06760 [Hazenella sp. IB182357]|uniref:Uncharacterized protein n=1 Tax=Polycladospora coralii TaxID=2771432 RepID=A0A926RU79_9BACL|nr:hypothetical protein [Polycladospora coralii]MBD1372059.1 hypothetical protein [Polycladospora coralii]MBS7530565.1 hypothetical protein [Polycladospora coralii]
MNDMQRPHNIQVPYSVVENLPPAERFLYYELCRLATDHATVDDQFDIHLTKGVLITSNYRLSKILDYAYSLVERSMEALMDKGLIDISYINEREFPSFYMVRVKEVFTNYELPEQIEAKYTHS